MTDDQEAEPIVVDGSAIPAAVTSSLRTLLVAFGAFGAGKGWFDENLATAAVGFLFVAAPWAWGQYRNWRNNQKARAMASLLPDRLAKVK